MYVYYSNNTNNFLKPLNDVYKKEVIWKWNATYKFKLFSVFGQHSSVPHP